jgi:predicted acyltransferase
MRDKTVQVRWTNKSSSGAIKYSYIDMSQSIIESLEDALSYANSTVAIVVFVHKL